MAFNSAVFYDIENLLKGYSFSTQVLSSLSLREIVESVKKTDLLSGIAVQRAYANWSDLRLSVMRGEINELGIDPVQVFGFSWDQKKNAADLQLAIDAVDLAHVRPSIDVFVIVSGDGGFAALAKKLHEYGKTVIGCAYPGAANRTFRAVCDAFVSIPDPENGRDSQVVVPVLSGPSGPLAARVLKAIKRAPSPNRETVLAKTREVITWIQADPACRAELAARGVHLAAIGEAIRQVMPDFEAARAGFTKMGEFLQHICAGTKLHVLRYPTGEATLALRSSVPADATVLPDFDDAYLRSPAYLRNIFATGAPILRLPDGGEIGTVVTWVAQSLRHETDLGSAIEAASSGLGGSVSSEAIKRSLLCCVSSGIFDRKPEGTPLAEQRITLKSGFYSGQDIIAALLGTAREKAQGIVGPVTDASLERAFFEAASIAL
jgi:uncharacterized LabA/DUF88 family protein